MSDKNIHDNAASSQMGSFLGGGLADIPNEAGLITTKDIYGNTITKPALWWYYYNQLGAQSSVFKDHRGLLNQAVDMAWDQPGGELTPAQIMILAYKNKIPIASFSKPTGGGGGGKSAEARANDIRSIALTIQNTATSLGINLSDDVIAYISTVAEKQNFSKEQLMASITNLTDWENLKPGDLSNNVNELKQNGKSYLINLDDKTAREWSMRIANGSMTKEGALAILSQQAKTAHPWLTDTIDQGIAPNDMLATARNKISSSLGIEAGSIDFTNDQYLNMVTMKDDKGNTRLANNTEMQMNIRKDSRWAKSQEASQLGTSMTGLLAKIFGKSAF